MKNLVKMIVGADLEQHSVRFEITVMVGGVPVIASFAWAMGADIYTGDVASTAKEAKKAY